MSERFLIYPTAFLTALSYEIRYGLRNLSITEENVDHYYTNVRLLFTGDYRWTPLQTDLLNTCVIQFLDCVRTFVLLHVELDNRGINNVKKWLGIIDNLAGIASITNKFLFFELILRTSALQHFPIWFNREFLLHLNRLFEIDTELIFTTDREIQFLLRTVTKWIKIMMVSGDYEYQVVLVEIIINTCKEHHLDEIFEHLDDLAFLKRMFLKVHSRIDYVNDLEALLSTINNNNLHRIRSIPCLNVTLEDRVIPPLKGGAYTCMHINYGVNTLSFNCDQNSLRSPPISQSLSNFDEFVTVNFEDINKIGLSINNDCEGVNTGGGIFSINISGQCSCRFDSSKEMVYSIKKITLKVSVGAHLNFLYDEFSKICGNRCKLWFKQENTISTKKGNFLQKKTSPLIWHNLSFNTENRRKNLMKEIASIASNPENLLTQDSKFDNSLTLENKENNGTNDDTKNCNLIINDCNSDLVEAKSNSENVNKKASSIDMDLSAQTVKIDKWHFPKNIPDDLISEIITSESNAKPERDFDNISIISISSTEESDSVVEFPDNPIEEQASESYSCDLAMIISENNEAYDGIRNSETPEINLNKGVIQKNDNLIINDCNSDLVEAKSNSENVNKEASSIDMDLSAQTVKIDKWHFPKNIPDDLISEIITSESNAKPERDFDNISIISISSTEESDSVVEFPDNPIEEQASESYSCDPAMIISENNEAYDGIRNSETPEINLNKGVIQKNDNLIINDCNSDLVEAKSNSEIVNKEASSIDMDLSAQTVKIDKWHFPKNIPDDLISEIIISESNEKRERGMEHNSSQVACNEQHKSSNVAVAQNKVNILSNTRIAPPLCNKFNQSNNDFQLLNDKYVAVVNELQKVKNELAHVTQKLEAWEPKTKEAAELTRNLETKKRLSDTPVTGNAEKKSKLTYKSKEINENMNFNQEFDAFIKASLLDKVEPVKERKLIREVQSISTKQKSKENFEKLEVINEEDLGLATNKTIPRANEFNKKIDLDFDNFKMEKENDDLYNVIRKPHRSFKKSDKTGEANKTREIQRDEEYYQHVDSMYGFDAMLYALTSYLATWPEKKFKKPRKKNTRKIVLRLRKNARSKSKNKK